MGHISQYSTFLNLHRAQLIDSQIPECYWNTLHKKLQKQQFDIGNTFRLVKVQYGEEGKQPHDPSWALQALKDVSPRDGRNIWLIDHAWTFRVHNARKQLGEMSQLRERLANMLGLSLNGNSEEDAAQIFENMWKLCHVYYSIYNTTNIEDSLPIWYIMDEIGSAVMHRIKANCRLVPFFKNDERITYSLIYPLKQVIVNDLVTSDFVRGITNEVQIKAVLMPWEPYYFDDYDITPKIPDKKYYLEGHTPEYLPFTIQEYKTIKKNTYKVYSEYSVLNQYLTLDEFELTTDEDEADILWYNKHFTNFAKLSLTPEKFVNQFPYEYVITIKDLLCLTCRQSENSSKWLPITYNLKNEIANFIKYFKHREKCDLDNYWIIKPYNLARGLDTHITNNLDFITRLFMIGPKIAQKYIINPVLFYRSECEANVKFDIRYIILLKQVKPLEVYVYKNFFLRFANQPFELKDFHIYEKHFTVMNYEENTTMRHMKCDEFKESWEEQYPDNDWKDIEKLVKEMIKDIFISACKNEPPTGIAHSYQSRAVYAADIILEWTDEINIQPKILEINFAPDCQRACTYYSNFYNEIFKLLFLNDNSSDEFYKL